MSDTLDAWFRRSAAAHPNDCAIEVDGNQVSYHGLDLLVRQAAEQILTARQGVPPRRVGLLANRDLSTYIGYLAALRLGSTVVPLNPLFPDERNGAIVRAAGPEVVLTGAGQQVAFSDQPTLRVADTVLPEPALYGGPCGAADAGDIAYILFTSGSTGRPKGVPISHRAVDAYLRHVIPRYELGPGCRLSHTFDLTFDPSVFDLFAAWGSGATLVVPSRQELLSPARFVNGRRITHWCSVPSIVSFAARLRGLGPAVMPDLRWSMFVGEALTETAAQAWQRAAPTSVIENIYGPTELTISCTEFRLPQDPANWPRTSNGTVPIGALYPSLECVLVGEDGRADPLEGELCVRGPQRFDGYHDPADDIGRFYTEDNGRFTAYDGSVALTALHWYRTGDLVSTTPDGLLHRGRLDTQLKLRGYRVELSEIEQCLRNLPGVMDAVVVPLTGSDGEVELRAMYTGLAQEEDAARDALSAVLPTYMVPRSLVLAAELPLNANGKIDRRAVAAQLSLSAAEL